MDVRKRSGKVENITKEDIINVLFEKDMSINDAFIELESIIRALKRQQPMEIKNRKELYDSSGCVYGFVGTCPSCRNRKMVNKSSTYCDDCGQKLDWGE